jgi:hypothetical protein
MRYFQIFFWLALTLVSAVTFLITGEAGVLGAELFSVGMAFRAAFFHLQT